jgi:hypothetical protein
MPSQTKHILKILKTDFENFENSSQALHSLSDAEKKI